MKYRLNSLEETNKFAARLAKELGNGSVLAMNGDLGAGKTTFTKALVKALNGEESVSSPTFVIFHVYEGTYNIYHFDLYRLASIDDLENIGALDYIPAPNGITLIEWAAKIPEALPADYLQLDFKFIDDNSREIELTGHGKCQKLETIQWPH